MSTTPEALLIRHADDADYPALIGKVDEWWGGRQMAAMLPRLFFQHFRPTSFVAELDAAIAGFVVGFVSQTDPLNAYIHFVGVDPAHRGAGIGQRLYGEFFAAARAAGVTSVGCVTSTVNQPSVAFHTAMGFWGETKLAYDGPGEDRVVFSRSL